MTDNFLKGKYRRLKFFSAGQMGGELTTYVTEFQFCVRLIAPFLFSIGFGQTFTDLSLSFSAYIKINCNIRVNFPLRSCGKALHSEHETARGCTVLYRNRKKYYNA